MPKKTTTTVAGKPKKLTPRDKVIIQAAATGENMPAIGKRLGVSRQAIQKKLSRDDIAKEVEKKIESSGKHARLSLERKHEILKDIAETDFKTAKDRISAIHTDNLMAHVYEPGSASGEQLTIYNNLLVQIGVLPTGSKLSALPGPVGNEGIIEGEVIQAQET